MNKNKSKFWIGALAAIVLSTAATTTWASCFGALPFDRSLVGGCFDWQYLQEHSDPVTAAANVNYQGGTYRGTEGSFYVTGIEANKITGRLGYAVGALALTLAPEAPGNADRPFTLRVHTVGGSFQQVYSAPNDYGLVIVRRGTTFDIYKVNGDTGVSVRWDGQTYPSRYRSYQDFPVAFIFIQSIANVDFNQMVKAYFPIVPHPNGGEGLIPVDQFLPTIKGEISANKAFARPGEIVQLAWNAHESF